MWKIDKIKATNLCAFRDLEYAPNQNCTTLIFGQNLDNDSQGSNGSGKSALIEAFSIALTGESLRKVNSEEIINDSCDEAVVSCNLTNNNSGESLFIERVFSRNDSQTIHVSKNDEAVVLPSINEYNNYILCALGMAREDIFSSYILSKHKYTSFLNASDRAKKDLINRFSNGNLVDDSLQHLDTDIQSANNDVLLEEKNVARAEGHVSAIRDQIDSIQAEENERKNRKLELIGAHREAIARLRGQIREHNESIEICKNQINQIDNVIALEIESLENGPNDIKKCYDEILKIIQKPPFTGRVLKDYPKYSGELLAKLKEREGVIEMHTANLNHLNNKLKEAHTECSEISFELETFQANSQPKIKSLQKEISEADDNIKELTVKSREYATQIVELNRNIAQLKASLAGVIECPSCHFKFILESDESVDKLTAQLEKQQRQLRKISKAEAGTTSQLETSQKEISTYRSSLADIDRQISILSQKVREANDSVSVLKSQFDLTSNRLSHEQSAQNQLQQKIASLRKELFDVTFDTIDSTITDLKSKISQKEVAIQTFLGNIESYENAIIELEAATDSTTLQDLESRLTKHEEVLRNNLEILNNKKALLSELQRQEARFIEFKTHLANSKIEALSALTNEFLNKIGSDIQVSFSGYTVLRSGKIRDKISVSLLRNGIDCGSFAKFSAGEQCRVNLASILALHKLTNMNCDDGKGLDLLILDEILEATDEAGLANMFEALNSLKITSMVVSHGQVAESYPYRLTISKQNGISTINANKL